MIAETRRRRWGPPRPRRAAEPPATAACRLARDCSDGHALALYDLHGAAVYGFVRRLAAAPLAADVTVAVFVAAHGEQHTAPATRADLLRDARRRLAAHYLPGPG